MLNGRIMIVSDRQEVIAELEPIIRAGQHLPLTVADGREALQTLEEGLVPDIVISDLGCDRALQGIDYVWRFRELNRVGRHMVVVEDGAPFSGFTRPAGGDGAALPLLATPLARPFRRGEVTARVEEAIHRVDEDLRALRGEMWREMQRMQRAMREMQRETVNALAATVAARDPYMHGHATRVAGLCRAVATALHLSEERIELLETAAILHEIGKAGVPLELLHKTGPLSPEELEQIRGHARTGAGIVAGVPALRRAAPLIEHQGTDYAELGAHLDPASPEHLLAGILRVVDAYDAMVSPRSYRGPMPRDYWEQTLRAGAGTRFHPRAVEAFLRLSPGDPRPAARTP
jgi:response regulator RpfG family c-di-GMP phosphodiesterase